MTEQKFEYDIAFSFAQKDETLAYSIYLLLNDRLKCFIYSEEPLNGVWKTEFKEFNKYLSTRPLHLYQQRVFDTKGNAKGSFVCDLRDSIFERII